MGPHVVTMTDAWTDSSAQYLTIDFVGPFYSLPPNAPPTSSILAYLGDGSRKHDDTNPGRLGRFTVIYSIGMGRKSM